MRTLGAVLSYYHDEKNQTYMNPVQTLSKRGKRKTKTGKWFKVGRRTSLVKSSELPAWHKAVMALSNTDMRDFLLFLLFTGLRRGEAAKLKWQDVDFVEKVYKVLDPKNGIDVIVAVYNSASGIDGEFLTWTPHENSGPLISRTVQRGD